MIPSTADSPGFISAPPAWEYGVELVQSMETGEFVSRAGLEQRQQRRQRGAFSIDWTTIYDAAALYTRNAAAVAELDKPLVVPFWSEIALTTTGIVANVVSIDRAPDADWFTAGEYVLFDSDSQGRQFRLINSTAGSALTLAALGGATAFTSGTRIFPCRLCLREGQRAEWIQPASGSATERMKFATL